MFCTELFFWGLYAASLPVFSDSDSGVIESWPVHVTAVEVGESGAGQLHAYTHFI